MKQIVFYFICFISASTYSQETIEDDPVFESKPFSFGFSFAPELTSRVLTSVDGSQSSKEMISYFDSTQTAKFGFTGGLNIITDINHRLSFETGLHYSNKGFSIKEFDLTYSYPSLDNPTSFRANYSLHYIEIPTKLNINFNHENTRYFISAGLATGFLLMASSTSIYSYADGSTKRNSAQVYGELKKLSLSPTLGFGLDFFINEKSSFRIEPSFRYSVLPIIKDAISKTYMWSAGINFCYYIKL